ncbi:MAG TPA: ABC transporter ATP-binding protein [Anaerolineae bacterium]|nr:ABC transporter ATP-binding protein [Anaerolineae bacterium]
MTPAIQFQRLSKKFKLNPTRARSFQERLVRWRAGSATQEFWVLQDINFEIQPGETVGLIGPNGSGKSTLLKLISRIIDPSSGKVTTHGRIASLLELGAGFHPDLSGRENIFLNASILGIPRPVIRRCLDDILDFAQVGPFIDVPVRNYSSGMAMRLGFAITTTLDPDILLIDEILAVGDHNFQRKCFDRLETLRARGVTTVLVSHTLEQVQQLCRRAIWLDKGRVRADGDAEAVISMYLDAERASGYRRYLPKIKRGMEGITRGGTYQAEIVAVELLDAQGQPREIFETGEFFCLRIHYCTQAPVTDPAFGMAFYRSDGLHLNGPNTAAAGLRIPVIDGQGYIDYIVEQLPLTTGRYEIAISIHSSDLATGYDYHHRLYSFDVRDRRAHPELGVVHISARWRHAPEAPAPQ